MAILTDKGGVLQGIFDQLFFMNLGYTSNKLWHDSNDIKHYFGGLSTSQQGLERASLTQKVPKMGLIQKAARDCSLIQYGYKVQNLSLLAAREASKNFLISFE